VHVTDCHGDYVAGPYAGLQHQPHERLVPAIAQVGTTAGREQGPELVVVEAIHDLHVQARRSPTSWSVAISCSSVSQAEYRRSAS
jgi:hypothetical protein